MKIIITHLLCLLTPLMIVPASVKERAKQYEQRTGASATYQPKKPEPPVRAKVAAYEQKIQAAEKEKNKEDVKVWANMEILYGSQTGDLAKVKEALSYGANINVRSKFGDQDTPLMVAASYGKNDIVEFLLANKAGVNVQNQKGNTALMWAVTYNFKIIAEMLLKAGANTKLKNKEGLTALDIARKYGAQDCINLLEPSGAGATQEEENRVWANQAILHASSIGDLAQVKEALNYGANLNTPSQEGDQNTPLMFAAMNGRDGVVEFLLANKVNVNAQNKKGFTALMWAVNYNHAKTAELLLKAGANTKLKNNEGLTALDIARVYDAKGCIDVLESLGEAAVEKVGGISPYAVLGIPDGADDARILGLTKEQLNDKSAVKKAYRAFALIWHPDKMKENEIAKKRYAAPDIKKLDDTQKYKLATLVWQLIQRAYERHK